jgi:hypothetical protein
VDPKTVRHLLIAERNRNLALALLDPARGGLRPTPWEWITVMAFYAAVHAVNAYLWESRRFVPSSHGDRSREAQFSLPISQCRASYQLVNRAGYRERYDDRFSLTEQGSRTLLNVHFRQVEATVMQALGQPAPVW